MFRQPDTVGNVPWPSFLLRSCHTRRAQVQDIESKRPPLTCCRVRLGPLFSLSFGLASFPYGRGEQERHRGEGLVQGAIGCLASQSVPKKLAMARRCFPPFSCRSPFYFHQKELSLSLTLASKKKKPWTPKNETGDFSLPVLSRGG